MSGPELEISDGETLVSRKMDSKPRSTKLTYNDYTVGWVCALPKEQTAATVMLDRRHPDLPKRRGDHNIYTCGSIGRHNIVIACLPKGKHGNNSIAALSTRMIATFPFIGVCLIVGIGSGIPPNVQLGDVVISTPGNGYAGVVQWDMGKAEPDGKFKPITALNSPPDVLLIAVAKLETHNEIYGSSTRHCLDDIGRRYPNLAPRYTQPGPPGDSSPTSYILYHSQNKWVTMYLVLLEKIVGLLGYTLGWLVFASMRILEKQSPNTTHNALGQFQRKPEGTQVHYGLIASGNQIIENVKTRDRLNKAFGGNVLCIEMGAAGLTSHFPCLVIRGICDYADSSIDRGWQEYAAATAAATAKELLEYV
ncbi:purine and uridine phosphorylase [Aspergillus avenaceus]|uniref:Purine and uridine phosphorylase n=1 Tax=Aspergillus avenaceus TaxID=36643 RepID=A0A5N6TRZ0_ASPAV|nr:purine and uridine phosphorylase [Aspergillus avenaceus]